MLRTIKEKIAASKLKKKIDASMGLKFVVVMTCFVSLLMIAGTFFVARTLMDGEYRSIETRGREIGLFLGKAGSDFIVDRNIVALDSLVDEAAKSQDVLYAVVADANGAALSTPYVSFNRDNPEVKALMTGEMAGDVAALVAKVRQRFDVLEVAVEIKPRGTKIGTVTMGFATSGVQTVHPEYRFFAARDERRDRAGAVLPALCHGAEDDRGAHEGGRCRGFEHCRRRPPRERACEVR